MSPGALDILAARRRIRGHVDVTPLRASAWLSSIAGGRVWLKLECVQRTGSFKIRGAFNALICLAGPRAAAFAAGAASAPEEARAPLPAEAGSYIGGVARHTSSEIHVVTASAGNHGRAVALAAKTLGLQATVFTPRDAPQAKLGAIRRHGAALRAEFPDYDAAEIAARQFATETRRPFVSPYNHPDVIAGAGTIALEILEAAADIDTLVVPIGGGGLIAGVAIAAKAISPGIRVVGVEAEASHAFLTSARNGRITAIEPGPTIADGLGGNMEPGTITFEIIQRTVDEIVTVSEGELMDAMRGLVREEHVIAEGAGAATTAAILAGKAGATGNVAAIVSGGNIDAERLMWVLDG